MRYSYSPILFQILSYNVVSESTSTTQLPMTLLSPLLAGFSELLSASSVKFPEWLNWTRTVSSLNTFCNVMRCDDLATGLHVVFRLSTGPLKLEMDFMLLLMCWYICRPSYSFITRTPSTVNVTLFGYVDSVPGNSHGTLVPCGWDDTCESVLRQPWLHRRRSSLSSSRSNTSEVSTWVGRIRLSCRSFGALDVWSAIQIHSSQMCCCLTCARNFLTTGGRTCSLYLTLSSSTYVMISSNVR